LQQLFGSFLVLQTTYKPERESLAHLGVERSIVILKKGWVGARLSHLSPLWERSTARAQAGEGGSFYEERVMGKIGFFLRSLSPHPSQLALAYPSPAR